jgi:hypothetical protein
MRVRFQADADFSQRIISAVRRREPAIDFQIAGLLGLRGLGDPEVLALAAQEGRVLVSHDPTTMPAHFAKFVESETSTGLLIIRQRITIHRALEEIVYAWTESDASDWINQVRII